MRRNKQGLYKVTGTTLEGERVSAFVFANYAFGAVFELEKALGITLKFASPSNYPVEFDVWQDNSVTNSLPK